MPGIDMTFDYSRYRDVLKPEFADYLEHEPHATRVLNFQPRVISGWLQTDEYIFAINAGTGMPDTAPETRDRRVQVRRARRRLLDTAEMHIILDESVFWRAVDAEHPSEHVWHEQVKRLRQVNDCMLARILVLPFERSILGATQIPFTVLSFPDRPGLVYREGADSESLSLDPKRVDEYEEQFQRLADVSLGLNQYLAVAVERRAPSWLTYRGDT